MKLGIMQPYYFPYIGYFQLIHAVDRYVFLDTTQYVRRGWMNRNRIINIKEGTTYITVPVEKSPQGTAINDMRIDNSKDWKNTTISQLNEVYKKRAPYFSEVIDLVRRTLDSSNDSLSELNIQSISCVFEYLEMPFEFDVFSKMDLDIPNDCKGDEWTFHITNRMGYETYINPPGGRSFYDTEKFNAVGIDLKFIQPNLSIYNQEIGRFESGLSILDVLMFNSVPDVRTMLSDYKIL